MRISYLLALAMLAGISSMGQEATKLIVQSVEAADLQAWAPSENLRFASVVAEFGLLLRGSEYKGRASYRQVLRRARQAKGADLEGYRAEFIRLVEKAQLLAPYE